MNMPKPEFLRDGLSREIIQDPSIVLLDPKIRRFRPGMSVHRATSHGAGGSDRLIVLDSDAFLTGRRQLHYFGSTRVYRLWMKRYGNYLRGALVYPVCYDSEGKRIPGALLVASYG